VITELDLACRELMKNYFEVIQQDIYTMFEEEEIKRKKSMIDKKLQEEKKELKKLRKFAAIILTSLLLSAYFMYDAKPTPLNYLNEIYSHAK
jgi:hypothetical protein